MAGCPVFSEMIENTTVDPFAMFMKNLELLIDRYARTKEGIARRLTHCGRTLTWCDSRHRWVLEEQRMLIDTTLIKIK